MKIAVVGSGVSGLAATWALNCYSEHEVHLFEAADRPGGHTNTVEWNTPGKAEAGSTYVDTGFIVFNTLTYPNLLNFLKTLSVPYFASDMSFAVTRDRGAFEWAGGSPAQLFAQRSNLLNPSHWRMVWDIIRFNSGALKVLREGDKGESIGSYLRRESYSDAFRDNYLLPMTAAIWSTPPDKAALDFPAFTLIKFMHNHALLQLIDRPTWLTVKDGAHSYVKEVLAKLPEGHWHPGTAIVAVDAEGGGEGVKLRTAKGEEWEFDQVVFATHADTTLSILKGGKGITKDERDVLSGFEFSKNRAVLHADTDFMPVRRSTWSAWNYLTQSDGPRANVGTVSLTYWMNLLQAIPEKTFGPVLVTLNPPREPRPELVVGSWDYEHPLFTEESVVAQKRLPEIQGKRGVWFAGAWSAYGFHEDGFSSGLRVAQSLGAKVPFEVKHAQRELPYTAQDKALDGVLFAAELARSIVERPVGWALLALSLVARASVLTLVGAGLMAGLVAGSGLPGRRLALKAQGVARFWAGEVSGVGEHWKRAGAGRVKQD